jgi:hypothetical protein
VAEWVLERFADAVAWGPGLAGLAVELGLAAGAELDGAGAGSTAGVGVRDQRATTTRRAEALAALDAAHAVLLGFSRQDLKLALNAFPGLIRRESLAFGRFRTGELALAAYDRLTGES